MTTGPSNGTGRLRVERRHQFNGIATVDALHIDVPGLHVEIALSCNTLVPAVRLGWLLVPRDLRFFVGPYTATVRWWPVRRAPTLTRALIEQEAKIETAELILDMVKKGDGYFAIREYVDSLRRGRGNLLEQVTIARSQGDKEAAAQRGRQAWLEAEAEGNEAGIGDLMDADINAQRYYEQKAQNEDR